MSVEKFGPFYFEDGECKVRKMDMYREIEIRGGAKIMEENMMLHNALFSTMVKPKPKPGKPKPGC